MSKLHIKDLPADGYDRALYDDLVENFQIIDDYMNGGSAVNGKSEVQDALNRMNARITNIAAGNIDQMALDQAVDQAVDAALKRKGVI